MDILANQPYNCRYMVRPTTPMIGNVCYTPWALKLFEARNLSDLLRMNISLHVHIPPVLAANTSLIYGSRNWRVYVARARRAGPHVTGYRRVNTCRLNRIDRKHLARYRMIQTQRE